MTTIKKLLRFGFLFLCCTIIAACNSQTESHPTIFPITPEPSAMATRFPAIGILTPFPPHTTKQIAINYIDTGDYSVFNMLFIERFRYGRSKLVLYSDGQLIIAGHPYQQKMLTPDEIKQLLSRLDNLGFFRLHSNGEHDLTDELYSFGNDYHSSEDASSFCVFIFVNEKDRQNLCAYKPFLGDLVPEMKNVLQFLDEYHPEGLSVYNPDRVLLWIQQGRHLDNDSLLQSAFPWPEYFPSLEGFDRKLLYIDGEGARKISDFFGNTDTVKVIIQNGIEYTVHIQIVLPHEELVNWFK